jgi:hypothetical protein
MIDTRKWDFKCRSFGICGDHLPVNWYLRVYEVPTWVGTVPNSDRSLIPSRIPSLNLRFTVVGSIMTVCPSGETKSTVYPL